MHKNNTDGESITIKTVTVWYGCEESNWKCRPSGRKKQNTYTQHRYINVVNKATSAKYICVKRVAVLQLVATGSRSEINSCARTSHLLTSLKALEALANVAIDPKPTMNFLVAENLQTPQTKRALEYLRCGDRTIRFENRILLTTCECALKQKLLATSFL